MALIIIYFILRRIPLLDDSIGLKKELKVIAYFKLLYVILAVLLRVLFPNFDRIDERLVQYQPIASKGGIILFRLSDFAINYMQTRWVVNKFTRVQHRASMASCMDPTAITLSTTGMRKAVHEQTLRHSNNPEESLYSDDQDRRLEMKRILSDHTVFEAFMRSLLKVLLSY